MRKKRNKLDKSRFCIYLYVYFSGLRYGSVHPSVGWPSLFLLLRPDPFYVDLGSLDVLVTQDAAD